jgi:hypothetical protein
LLLLIGLLLLLLQLLSYRCGDYYICEGAIEGVVEMSFFSCYFQSCLLALICLLVAIFFQVNHMLVLKLLSGAMALFSMLVFGFGRAL